MCRSRENSAEILTLGRKAVQLEWIFFEEKIYSTVDRSAINIKTFSEKMFTKITKKG